MQQESTAMQEKYSNGLSKYLWEPHSKRLVSDIQPLSKHRNLSTLLKAETDDVTEFPTLSFAPKHLLCNIPNSHTAGLQDVELRGD